MMISYSEFLALPVEKQAQMLDEMRKEHGVGNLVKMWGISTSRLYHLIHDLNLPVSKRGRKAKTSKKSSLVSKSSIEAIRPIKSPELKDVTAKLTLSLSAEGQGEILLQRLQPLFMAMAAANIKFKISVIAEEV